MTAPASLPCPACAGSGLTADRLHDCDLCGGGKTLSSYEYHDFIATYAAPRPACLICQAPISSQGICRRCEETGQRLDGKGPRSVQELAREVR